MKRIIYSLYIDIPLKELDEQPPHFNSTISKTLHTKEEFQKYYDFLLQCQTAYAKKNHTDYILFKNDDQFKQYKSWFLKEYPQITSYNIVNFYKIHLMYKLLEKYDEVLYIDFDIIPVKSYNFFDHWDLNKGICVLSGTQPSQRGISFSMPDILKEKDKTHSNRSPIAKYWNAHAMLSESDNSVEGCDVFNTGIVGINRKFADKLKYFENFSETISFMTELQKRTDLMYPPYIQKLFGYDNETIWAWKILSKNISHQSLGEDWHYFMDKWSFIPESAILVHCINKDFKFAKGWYEENNIFDIFR